MSKSNLHQYQISSNASIGMLIHGAIDNLKNIQSLPHPSCIDMMLIDTKCMLEQALKLERQSALDSGKRLERQRCLAIVEQEEELPGPMPDEVFKAIAKSVVDNDRDLLAEQLRSIVRSTKQSIGSKIKEE